MSTALRWRRWLLPAGAFLAVGLAHFLWLGFYPERDPVQAQWVTVPAHGSWLKTYIQAQSYWLGFSYAFSLAFAAVALRRYREGRFCTARNLAIGGVTFSGALSVAGCYLLGCCGSPMLGVYISLFGAAFIPWAKPLAAVVTLFTIGTAWWWMNLRTRVVLNEATSHCTCPDHEHGNCTQKVSAS
jgi:hypothetical protein